MRSRFTLGFEVSRLGFEVFGLGVEVSGLGFDVLGLGFEIPKLGFEVPRLGFEYSGLGSKQKPQEANTEVCKINMQVREGGVESRSPDRPRGPLAPRPVGSRRKIRGGRRVGAVGGHGSAEPRRAVSGNAPRERR